MGQKLADQFAGLAGQDPRPARHRHIQTPAAAPGAVLARTRASVDCSELPPDLKIRQSVDAFVGHEIYAATVATVAAIRTAARNVFLTPKTHAAVTAVTGLNLDSGFINEFHVLSTNKKPRLGGVFLISEIKYPRSGRVRHHADEQSFLRATAVERNAAI
jgi:hypothetical protein